jgi:hypothetical protein
MKEIAGFIRRYAKEVNKPILVICTLFIAVLIWLNYSHRLEYRLVYDTNLPAPHISAHFILFLVAFWIPYILVLSIGKKMKYVDIRFMITALLAPFIFAMKAGMDTNFTITADPHWNQYWNDILYWPLRLITTLILLAGVHRFFCKDDSYYGLLPKKMNWTPYLLMLLIMVPLITAASTQADFLATYPKMKEVLPLPDGAHPSWLYKLLFELSYGSDFFSIEIFFRGFLVIGFMKWVGKDAILPMACFYCTIHFGKPLGECISSYFGGMLLGIVSYHTRSIYGGLMVHLGIAWMMEVGGYIGRSFH